MSVTPARDDQGMVYLVHLDRPYEHAKHYVGFTERDVEGRVAYHRRGQGSRLLKAVAEAGIEFRVVRVWPGGDRNFERRLKCHSATRLCPVCVGHPRQCEGRFSIVEAPLVIPEPEIVESSSGGKILVEPRPSGLPHLSECAALNFGLPCSCDDPIAPEWTLS